MENTSNIHIKVLYVWLSFLTIILAIYFGRIIFKNWKAKRANLGFGLGPFSANVDLEREKANKSAEEVIKKFEGKDKLSKEAINLALKTVVRNYKTLTENQQNFLLQEQEKRIRLEEEIKSWKMLNSWNEKDRDKYSKESKEFENKFWQLKIILSYYGFKQKDIDKIVDGNVSPLEWERKLEIQKKQKEITDKRFKCNRCDKCNKENSN